MLWEDVILNRANGESGYAGKYIQYKLPDRTEPVQLHTIVSHNPEVVEQIQVIGLPVGFSFGNAGMFIKASVVLWLAQGLLQVCWGFKGDEERPFEAAEVHALTFSSPVSDSLEAMRMTA